MSLRKRGFSLIEILAVLIVGAVIMGALLSTLVSVLRGTSGLMHYSDMKHQSDRLLSYFTNDVSQATRIEFPATQSDELLAFQFYNGGTPLVTYSYGIDSTPPQGLSGTVYCVYREPFGLSRYEIASGFTSLPAEDIDNDGDDESSLFFFANSQNEWFDHTSVTGRRLASRGTSKIRLKGMMERGGGGDYPITHEVFNLSVLKNRVSNNSGS